MWLTMLSQPMRSLNHLRLARSTLFARPACPARGVQKRNRLKNVTRRNKNLRDSAAFRSASHCGHRLIMPMSFVLLPPPSARARPPAEMLLFEPFPCRPCPHGRDTGAISR